MAIPGKNERVLSGEEAVIKRPERSTNSYVTSGPLRRKRTLVTFPMESSPWVTSRLCRIEIQKAMSKKIKGSTMNGIVLQRSELIASLLGLARHSTTRNPINKLGIITHVAVSKA